MPDKTEEIRQNVIERFTKLAESPESEKLFPVGPESAKKLGYDADKVDALPASITESFCGVGNPLSLGQVLPGDTVIDLGCGSGMDSILAAFKTGSTGKVIGVDMTLAMVCKAQQNAELLSVTNVEFRHGRLEDLPVENNSVDVALTNGVFNLCVDKAAVFQEVHRVLRPGGRLLMADILLHENVTPAELDEIGTWSD